MIVEWNPERSKKKIEESIRNTLSEGGIVAYPTDTFYGLGCDLFNIKSVRRLYGLKMFDEKRPLSIICRDLKEVSIYAVVSNLSFEIMKRVLPGPYTFILKARKIIPKLLMTERREVGVRVPAHPVPVSTVRLLDRPIINTTARVPGGEVIEDPREIAKKFKGSVDLVIDGGIIVGEPSTILRVNEDSVEVVRMGKGSLKNLPLT